MMRTLLDRTLFVLLLIALPATASAQAADPSGSADPIHATDAALSELPIDPAVTIGTLPNGLRYYIRANGEPERRAELRLVVKAGSLQEDEDQRGLAHFLEHMAFNGTENFEKQELVRQLEAIGMRFGADLNASTTYDHTLYRLTVPTDEPDVVETAFQILDDWARRIALEPEDVEAERGVVLSEWRGRLGVGTRIRVRTDSLLLGDSRYLDRSPIGLPERIESADRQTLLRFYRDWYRPDLMAVVVTGDIDVDRIEAIVQERFGDMPAPGRRAPERQAYTVPDHDEPRVAVITDPELTGSRVELIQRYSPHPVNSVERAHDNMVRSIFAAILNKRLRDISTRSGAPFLGASTRFGSYVGGQRVHTVVNVTVRDDEMVEGFRAALAEVERIAQHGITAEELDREKRAAESRFNQALVTSSKITSASRADAYIRHFLSGQTPASVEATVDLSRALLERITAEEVAAVAEHWKRGDNLALVALTPEKEGVSAPSGDALLAVLDEVRQTPLDASPSDDATRADSDALLATIPAPGAVVEEGFVPEVGITQWMLANGARVLLMPTDFSPDQVLFYGYSWGGTSVLADERLPDATLARSLPAISGLGPYDASGLRNAVVGKLLRVGVSIGAYTQSVSGQSTVRDLEAFLQLVHLHFTAPRIDEGAIEAWKHRNRTALEGRAANPETHFTDTINAVLAQGHPRRRTLTLEDIDAIDPARALEIYRERFADAGDFTFVLVGDFEPDSVRGLVETYVGGLPTEPGTRGWRDNGVRAPEERIEKEFRFGREPRARVGFVFNGEFRHSHDEQSALGAMTQVLNHRLRERLREQLGGTYSVRVHPELRAVPQRTYSVRITFDAAPDRIDEMREAVYEEIERLREHGPTQEEVEQIQAEYAKQMELSVKNNSFWLRIITSYDQTERPLAELAEYEKAYRILNRDLLHAMSREYLDLDRHVRVTQLPAN